MSETEFMKTGKASDLQKYEVQYMGDTITIDNRSMCSISTEDPFEHQYENSGDFYIFIDSLSLYYEEALERFKKEYDKLYDVAFLTLSCKSKYEVLMYAGYRVDNEAIRKKYDATAPTDTLVKKCVANVSFPSGVTSLSSLENNIQQLEKTLRKISRTKKLCEIKEDKLRSLNRNERELRSRL